MIALSLRGCPSLAVVLALTGCQDHTGSSDDAPTTTQTGEDSTAGSASSTPGSSSTQADTSTQDTATTGSTLEATLSEIDCHRRDRVEIASESGVDLGGLEILINGVLDYTLPAGSISEGLFVVREADLDEPGLTANIGCSDDEVALVFDGVVLDSLAFPPFPGAFEGTTWCSGVSAAPFDLCTPTIGEPNLAYVDPGTVLFDRLSPIEIDLTIDAAGINALNVEPKEYVAGTFAVTKAGVTTEPIMVGIALKGSLIGSFADLSGKAAFKIKFNFVDPETRFLGLEGVKLNNMREDASQIHEAIGYAAFGAAQVPAPRAGYSEVRLNGDSYGLHATIERVDDVWLSRYYESTVHLYEGTFGLDVNPGREDEFFVDEGDPLDLADLTALMAVTVVPDDQYLAALQTRVHLEPALRNWAASMWLGHWDGYSAGQNNYGLQSDDEGVFDFVPSGLDQTQEQLIDLRQGTSPFQNQGVLFARCRANPTCSASYDDAVTETGAALEAFDVQAEIDAVVAAIEPWVVADPRRGTSIAQVHGAQDQTRGFWNQRAIDFP